MPPMDFSKPEQPTDGIHTVQCVAATQGITSNGNLKIALRWRITASHDPVNVGKTLFDNVIFAEGSWFRVQNLIAACGLSTEAWQGQEPSPVIVQDIARSLMGEVINVKTAIKAGSNFNPQTNEPYPDRAEVQQYYPYAPLSNVDRLLAMPLDEHGLPF